MPDVRTAQYLVMGVRDKLGLYGTEYVRDGFEDDAVKERRLSILWVINSVLSEYVESGYRPCRFFISAGAGVMEYILPTEISDVDTVSWQGTPMDPLDRLALLTKYPQAETADYASGTPREYYIDGDVLGIYPRPEEDDTDYPASSATTSSIWIWGPGHQSDMVERDDVPERLPIGLQDDLVSVAAGKLAGSLISRLPEEMKTVLAVLAPEARRAMKRLTALSSGRNPNSRMTLTAYRPNRASRYTRP